jgi:hypothetical protein
MTRSNNITVLPPYEEPKSPYGTDEWLLKFCAEWRVFRAQMQQNWAKRDLANIFGSLPDPPGGPDSKPLERMREIENRLADVVPRTGRRAYELLGIALTVLAHRMEEPEDVLSDGPVLEIVRNVRKALEWLDATQLGPESVSSD